MGSPPTSVPRATVAFTTIPPIEAPRNALLSQGLFIAGPPTTRNTSAGRRRPMALRPLDRPGRPAGSLQDRPRRGSGQAPRRGGAPPTYRAGDGTILFETACIPGARTVESRRTGSKSSDLLPGVASPRVRLHPFATRSIARGWVLPAEGSKSPRPISRARVAVFGRPPSSSVSSIGKSSRSLAS